MRLSRDQARKSRNGVLGITAAGFQSQHRTALGGKAEEVQDALAIRCDSLAANPDFRLKLTSQSHELVGVAQARNSAHAGSFSENTFFRW